MSRASDWGKIALLALTIAGILVLIAFPEARP